MNQKNEEIWQIFWCDLLRPIIYDEIAPECTHLFLKELSQKEITFPNGVVKKPSLSTLKRKLAKYQKEGFDGLARKRREDRGKLRSVPQSVIDEAIALKKEQPKRSRRTLNLALEEKFGINVPRSTLYRHLKEAGATRLKLGVIKQPVRIRWTRDRPHELWVGDYEEGVYVSRDGQVVPTYLAAFIDCHTRYITAGRYYYRQNLDVLVDVLMRGMAVHGSPLAFYVDNAKVFHSNGLKSACYRFKIKLYYRKPRDPAGGGIIERFFRTVQDRFESEVRVGEILTLDRLNNAFSAWLAEDYHKQIHSEIRTSPESALAKSAPVIRQVNLSSFVASFMPRYERTVDRKFSDVRLNNRYYQANPRLRGDRVQVRFDPFVQTDRVQLYSLNGDYLGEGIQHDRSTAPSIPSPQSAGHIRHNHIELLERKHQATLALKAQGIDYRGLCNEREWPFIEFAGTVAELLGRKGGLSAFNSDEFEQLKKTWNTSTAINEPLVRKAIIIASQKNIQSLIYTIKQLIREKGESSCF